MENCSFGGDAVNCQEPAVYVAYRHRWLCARHRQMRATLDTSLPPDYLEAQRDAAAQAHQAELQATS